MIAQNLQELNQNHQTSSQEQNKLNDNNQSSIKNVNFKISQINEVTNQESEEVFTSMNANYFSDLLRPLSINANLQNLTQPHILTLQIKGGGSNDPQTPSNAFQSPLSPIQANLTQPNSLQNPLNPLQMVSPPLIMPIIPNQLPIIPNQVPMMQNQVPLIQNQVPLIQNQDLLTIYNVQNVQNVQAEDAFHQNLQRAFLQSAMAQNIQIQQQLLAQNQALQQLLHRQHAKEDVTNESDLKDQEGISSNFAERESKDSLVPVPPPMPNFLIDENEDIEKRPFMDPYGRAKTVRIGKWRWPPPKDDQHQATGEDYMHFKMRQVQRKITPVKENIHVTSSTQPVQIGQNSIDWDEIDFETASSPKSPPEKVQKAPPSNSKRSFEVGASRPSPGSIGKLKLSSEMRQRLEKVTFNHSVRSKNDEDKPSRVVNKLEDTRRLMLERQLGGKWDQSVDENRSNEPEAIRLSEGSEFFDQYADETSEISHLTVQKEIGEVKPNVNPVFSPQNFKVSPPPPPIGPNSRNLSGFLPPAPQIPAPPPPIRPPTQQTTQFDAFEDEFQSDLHDFRTKNQKEATQHQKDHKQSGQNAFILRRQDKDTFGAHQNVQSSVKRSSFSSNWDLDEKQSVGDGLNELDDEETWRNDEEERWDKKPSQQPQNHPTFRAHQFSRSEHEKKLSVSTLNTEKETLNTSNWGATPDFLLPTPPNSPKPIKNQNSPQEPTKTHLEALKSHLNPPQNPLNLNQTPYLTYNRVSWVLRLRKEVFRPLESLGTPSTIHLIFCQVVLDVYGSTGCPRLNQSEKKTGQSFLESFGVDLENFLSGFGLNIKRNVVEMARNWPLYFARLFKVSGAAQLCDVQILAVSHWGLHLVKKQANSLQVIKSFSLNEVQNCSSPRPTTLTVEFKANKVTLWTARAQQISEMVNKFCGENKKLQNKLSSPSKQQQQPSERLESILTSNEEPLSHETTARGMKHDVASPSREISPNSATTSNGRFSLLQFAQNHFRNYSDQDPTKPDQSPSKHKEKRKEWNRKHQMDLVKYQSTPLEDSLLKFEDKELNMLAVECFECILRYCGDLPLTQDLSEVKCVYTVLMHCHKHVPLRDEIYCQLIKQTTLNPNNPQINPYLNSSSSHFESFQRAWRLLSIIAAYFTCSDSLLPYLIDHLTSFSSDKNRIYHGTASVCLLNLRKTQKFGGRKNVPSIEEVTAVSAGRNFRRQIYRLPGGGERVVNTKNSTVVQDVIVELCGLIGIDENSEEKEEFSLYCIVQGDSFTMPLSFDEYILDVTTELQKTNQVFYLIFCRSIWFYPLKPEPNSLYIEILFNQLAPDYLEGLLLVLPTINPQNHIINDISFIAALLHRSADLKNPPNLKEVKFLLPKPLLTLKEPRPAQWLALVQNSWSQISNLSPITAKLTFLNVLKTWNLFGSSFFAVKLIVNSPESHKDYILALNRKGIHFLDLLTHETVKNWPFSEVISTRKVKSEEGLLFLDLKCGNLMQQRVTRLQTEQAHEISRLIRSYINLEQVQNIKNSRS